MIIRRGENRSHAKSFKPILAGLTAAILVGVAAALPLFKVTGVQAASITQGYKAANALPKGSVVSLTQAGSQDVELATTDNDGLLVGVVVDGQDALLDVQPQGSQVRVAVSGEVNLLVNTVNGDIKSGARLIASPIAGVAAVDDPPAPGVKYIAVADSDFNKNSAGAKEISVQLANGDKRTVYVGTIKARILLSNRAPGNGQDKNFLVSIARQISGKNVSMLQVLAAIAVLITCLALAGMILYGSIKGTFVSLGRNPLSRDSILTGLMRVVIVAILVLSIGVVISYLILVL